MTKSVFYSWQSDVRAAACRTLIGNALERVVSQLASDETLNVDPVVDRDVQNVPGSPDIGATIFAKIDRACAFVADVTIVAQTQAGKPSPNPNVLIELGYAFKALGDSRVVLVQNTAVGGGPELLPFDLRQKRVLTYASAPDDSERATARRGLEATLEVALRAIVSQDESRAAPGLELTLDYRTRSQTPEIHHYELVATVRNVGTRRLEDWEVEIELPTPLLEPGVHVGIRVADRSDGVRSLFRAGSHTLRQPLRIGDQREIKIGYRVDAEIYRRRDELFSQTAVARAMVDGQQVAEVVRPMSELENF